MVFVDIFSTKNMKKEQNKLLVHSQMHPCCLIFLDSEEFLFCVCDKATVDFSLLENSHK